jgi:GNAT superfamily N-acetyltransferase
MIECICLRVCQAIETAAEKGLARTLKECIYHREQAIPTVKDLSTLKPVKKPLEEAGVRLAEIVTEQDALPLRYALCSRRRKVPLNIRRGYRAFAAVRGEEVVGDIWYVRADAPGGLHPDTRLLGLTLTPSDAYLFDMYVAKDERGKAIVTSFMGSVLHRLRERGVARAYGFYMARNTPALWVHRLIGYQELPAVWFTRFLGRRYTSAAARAA